MTIPVTLIAGFLGAGKTTLVRRILRGAHGARCAVIVNEFGALGIDGDLIKGADVLAGSEGRAVVELANGCICCEIQDDLRTTLLALVEGDRARGRRWFGRAPRPSLERILVEASGAASPGPAVQTFLMDGTLQEALHLEGVVTVVHGALIEEQLRSTEEAVPQVAYGDRVLINHVDRMGPGDEERVMQLLGAMNPLAAVRSASFAEIELTWVFGDAGPRGGRLPPHLHGGEDPQGAARHTQGLSSISLTGDGPFDDEALVIWLEFLVRRQSHELMRIKGILRSQASGRWILVQGVYQWLEVSHEFAPVGDGDGDRSSRLVLIGRGLDEEEIERGFRAISAR